MYQTLLTRRYLTTKIMPLLASLSVLLCTSMVLVTWSVMGGFLDMLVKSGRTLVGDVVIGWPGVGFAHYDDLIQRLEADPAVEAATPVIEAFGQIAMPDGTRQGVILKGIDGPGYTRVTKYADTLWWKKLDKPTEKDTKGEDIRLEFPEVMERVFRHGLALERPNPDTGEMEPAVVPGIEVTGFNRRTSIGIYVPRSRLITRPDGSSKVVNQFLPRDGYVTIGLIPLDAGGKPIEPISAKFPVANDFQSGVFEVDNRTVFIHLAALQKLLSMDRATKVARTGKEPVRVEVDPVTGDERLVDAAPVVGEVPARVTNILVRGRGDYGRRGSASALRDRCGAIYAEFAAAHKGEVPDAFDIQLLTWEDLNRVMISAVEHERLLVLFIFSFISLTAVILVLAIFWSMISEKTRDIGILRALGASKAGVGSIWIAYAAAIGLVGAILGVAFAYAIVLNINDIHDWLGQALGIVIWNPSVYYFVKIPNRIEPVSAVAVLTAGIASCVLGAIVPAYRAANMHPVRALRFE